MAPAAAGRARAASLAAVVHVVAATVRPASSAAAAGVGVAALIVQGEDTPFGSVWWWAYAGISCFLVLFAGIMSGLTLGLMSLGLVELEILQRSGTDAEKAQAAAILPVVQKQHQLLVTLLLCNAVAMEALPIFLDRIFHPVVAVILSVTFVLAFGEVIPQAICTRYGLAVGANFACLVRILMVICYPISYPIGKLLDCALGHNESALFRRAQLKALVSIHSKEAGKGGELTHDETTIISGALDLTEKVYKGSRLPASHRVAHSEIVKIYGASHMQSTPVRVLLCSIQHLVPDFHLYADSLVFSKQSEMTAEEAMTPIESTFSLDVDSKLDWEAIGKILARGHSRVPVYSGNPTNIIGLLLVKSLLTVRAETETPVSAVSIRRIPRVPADMPLYDILNEFQKGSSHMAAVVKTKPKNAPPPDKTEPNREAAGAPQLTAPLLSNAEERVESVVVDIERPQNRQANRNKPHSMQQNDTPSNAVARSSEDIDDGEVIGIITLEDVFEELLQEEIVDETDEYVDVHKRIRVAAAAAASSVARAPSHRRLTSQKAAGAQSRQGQPTGILKKRTDGYSNPSKHQVNLVEPLLENRR